MYDEYARHLIDLLPELPHLDRAACRRALSTAYFHLLRLRLGVGDSQNAPEDLVRAQQLLRRMGDALESVAVFDPLHGQPRNPEIEGACAFVAAESLSLLSLLATNTENLDHATGDPFFRPSTYTAVESALLYMIGGFDANASTVVRDIDASPNIEAEGLRRSRMANAYYVLSRLQALCRGEVGRPRQDVPLVLLNGPAPGDYDSLLEDVRTRLYERLGTGIEAYLDWLGGYPEGQIETARNLIETVRNVSRAHDYSGYTAFADIYHLSSLILAAIDRSSQRTVMHNVPPPNIGPENDLAEFQRYLQGRARGTAGGRGRPFLWPSTLEYVRSCLPGPSKDSVIAMPTGSGKSFIAEVAITHALNKGWVLYLTPTNALAHQIRHDLSRALGAFRDIQIHPFVGGEEYTTLAEEQVAEAPTRLIAVMTPEKCALALRLYPERFSSCALCVFDECHLLADPHRGLVADVLLSQLCIHSPNARFLLMSAMVGNPDELKGWLDAARGGETSKLVIKWRPTRTLRGLLVVDEDSFERARRDASATLNTLPNRKNYKFQVQLALVAGLSGPWTTDGAPDYRITRVPAFASARVSRAPGESPFESWKNPSAAELAHMFARSGLPALCFVLSSRHHAFSCAERIQNPLLTPGGADSASLTLVNAWLAIADAELGVETALRNLFARGIAVHTSVMLQVEQAASEWMFAQGKTPLMFATGTLAQGLNLPAIAVVVAGTSMGDPRSQESPDTPAGITRVNSFILNGFGRAGRPGFANQGIAVLVSDDPYNARVVADLDASSVLQSYAVLGESDAAMDVHSPVEDFIDRVLTVGLSSVEASSTELELTSLLAEYDTDELNAEHILKHTLGGYHRRQVLADAPAGQIRSRLSTIKEEFLHQPGVPTWMNTAAMRAGVDLFRAWRMWSAYEQHGLIPAETTNALSVEDWLDVFFAVMALLPPRRVAAYLADETTKRPTVMKKLRDAVGTATDVDSLPWNIPPDWASLWQELKSIVLLYMRGASYIDIATVLLGLSADRITNKRTKGDQPIPSVFSFLRKVVDGLAIDAGCFLSVHQFGVCGDGAVSAIPENLQALPLCIRNGCNSLTSLSWFRFGFRQRACAHALARAFNMPHEVTTDSERAEWVRQTRRQWLAGHIKVQHEPLLAHAMTVIREGGAT